MNFLFKVRAILGVITDVLMKGRAMGWWTKKSSIDDYTKGK